MPARVLSGAAAAVIAMAGVIGLLLTTLAGPAGAATRLSWVMTGGNIGRMDDADHATTSWFFNTPSSYGTGSSLTNSPVQSNYTTTRVLNETSYAKFSSDLQKLSYPYKWVMYDPEAWSQTPVNEQRDPVKYMRLFGQLAHAHGLKVMQVPARNLASVPGSAYPRKSGETVDQWFVRVLAGPAAAAGDTLIIQDEANTANLTQYGWLFNQAKAKALAASPGVPVFSEVSTSNGTPQQMAAAAKSVNASGFYVAAPGAIPQAVQFFQIMKAAGY